LFVCRPNHDTALAAVAALFCPFPVAATFATVSPPIVAVAKIVFQLKPRLVLFTLLLLVLLRCL
jgi:hypothetical protein